METNEQEFTLYCSSEEFDDESTKSDTEKKLYLISGKSSKDSSNDHSLTLSNCSLASCDTTSLTDDCISETSLSPIVTTKIQILISVLKDIQNNMQEMNHIFVGNKITPLKIRNKENISGNSCVMDIKNSSENDPLKSLEFCEGSSQTDEAKLNEILTLLHNITDALSSYEEIPLLADHLTEINSAIKQHKVDAINPGINNLRSLNLEHSNLLPDDGTVPLDDIHEMASPHRADDPISSDLIKAGAKQHRFSKETKSLRHDIDEAIKRKDALNEKLKLYISQRHPTCNQSEDSSEQFFGTKLNNSDKEYDDVDKDETTDAGHFLPMSSIANSENSDGIEDLRRDEEVVLGLADSGLSDEINSLNNTIKKIINENQQYQAFFKDLSADSAISSCETPLENSPESNNSRTDKHKQLHDIEMEKFINIPSLNCDAETPYQPQTLSRQPNAEESSFTRCCNNNTTTLASLQSSFDTKLASLVKAQENTMKTIIKEKQTADERCRKLEQMVGEVMKVNAESKAKYWDELHGMDVENCRLQDELNNLYPRRNNKPAAAAMNSFNSISQSHDTHSVCQAQIEKLSREKETMLATLEHSSPTSRKRNQSTSSLHLKLSDSDLQAENYDCRKFSSLPVVNQSSSNDVLVSETSNAESTSLDEELHTLKVRVKFLESYLKKQYCHRTSSLSSIDSPDKKEFVEVQKERKIFLDSGQFPPNTKLPSLEDNAWKSDEIRHVQGSESSLLYQKIINLMEEKEILSSRLEELMAITRELAYHYKSTKLELSRVLISQKENSHCSKASMDSDSKTNTGNSLENSISENFEKTTFQAKEDYVVAQTTFAKDETDTQKVSTLKKNHILQQNGNESLLQERIQYLQAEAQKAWSEARDKSLQIEKLKVDKEKLNYFLTSSLSNVEQENLRLQSTVSALREENRVLCNELLTIRSCVSEKEIKNGSSLNDGRISDENLKKGSLNNESWREDEEKQVCSDKNITKCEGEKPNSDVNRCCDSDANVKWQQALVFLQRCLAEEKLQGQLLAAADMENSARVAVLKQAVREKGDMYQVLLSKYQRLRLMLVSKKAEKRHHKNLFQECSQKMEELNSTTTAIEGNYKVMLSTLGHNIGIAAEILSSHLYFAPTQIHPSPELNADPAFWFAAQCSRLRWLQSQLRKLCLHTWKSGLGNFLQEKQNNHGKVKKKLSSEFKSRSLDLSLNENRFTNKMVPPFSTQESCTESKINPASSNDLTDKLNQSSLHSIALNSTLLSTLSDAEISLTSQQVKLAQKKTSQFNHLVNLLKENSHYSSGTSIANPNGERPCSSLNESLPINDDFSISTEPDSGTSNNTKDFSIDDNELSFLEKKLSNKSSVTIRDDETMEGDDAVSSSSTNKNAIGTVSNDSDMVDDSPLRLYQHSGAINKLVLKKNSPSNGFDNVGSTVIGGSFSSSTPSRLITEQIPVMVHRGEQ